MANIDAPFGFKPIRHLNGESIVYAPAYSIASGYTSNIFGGDPVVKTGTGRQIALAAPATGNSIGIFAGCKFVDAAGDLKFYKYWPANTVATMIEAYVWEDPQIVFEVQCDVLNEADVGLLADWAAGSGGDPMTGISSHSLVASGGLTSGQAMRIMGLSQDPEAEYGNFANAEVLFAQHALANVVAGVGGV